MVYTVNSKLYIVVDKFLKLSILNFLFENFIYNIENTVVVQCY